MSKKKSLSANLVRLEEGPAPQGRGHDLCEVGYDSTCPTEQCGAPWLTACLQPVLSWAEQCRLLHLSPLTRIPLQQAGVLPAAPSCCANAALQFFWLPFLLVIPQGLWDLQRQRGRGVKGLELPPGLPSTTLQDWRGGTDVYHPQVLLPWDAALCAPARKRLEVPIYLLGPSVPSLLRFQLTSRAMRPGGGSGRGGRGLGRRDSSSGMRRGGSRPRTTSRGRGNGSGSGNGMASASGRLGPMTAGPAGAPPAPTATAALASSSPAAATTASSFSFRPRPRPRPSSRGAAGSSYRQEEDVSGDQSQALT